MIRFLLIITLSLSLYGFDKVTASKIFDTVFMGIENRQIKNIYSANQDYLEVIKLSDKFQIASVEKSDIIVFEKIDELEKIDKVNKLLFATSYSGFKKTPEAIGAFYWFKGRPQIVFLSNRLKERNIMLRDYLQKYITDEL